MEKIRSSSSGTQDLMFNLSACLTAARSVMDVLLYDYGDQYGLFTLNDEIRADDFQRLATTRSHADAVSFFSWWTAKVTFLANDPIAGFLSKKRHMLVHRGRPAMAWSLFFLAETISFSSSLVVNVPSRPAGSATPNALDVTAVPGPAGSASPPPTSPASAAAPRRSLTGHFADYPSESVINLCQKYLGMLSTIITEARTRFP